ncbi:GNAT family N-acetyltransferase [Ruegeria pomeroyi]|nr:GNAT family N-acetyltransferase [Ruegeria pomeroyi]MCE8528690.1 GNAT family N-acetyltransferase [Ruegeria pomeroyi]
MTPADLARLHGRAFTQSRPWSEAEFATLLGNPYNHLVGDNRCFALFQLIADEAELLTIATDPVYRRQGLARACMNEWQIQAAHAGATRALLDVADDNDPAIALYTACGYAPCGLRRGYYRRPSGETADAIVMERPLP